MSSSSPWEFIPNGTTISNEKHPTACLRCRQAHKKCDKKLPGCSKCKSAGVECVFETPKKRGKGSERYQNPSKKKKESKKEKEPIRNEMQPVASASSASSSKEEPKKIIATSDVMVDIYFTFICGVHPMIEKAKLEYFLKNYLSQFETKPRNEIVLESNSWIKSIGELRSLYAFYLSLMAVTCQVVADLENLEIFMRKAEMEIGFLSIDHSTEIYWALACHYVYICYIGEGDQYKQGYYLSKVSYFIESQEHSENPYLKVLKAHSAIIKARYKSDIFTLQTLLQMTKEMFFYFTGKRIEEILLPGTWDYLMNTKLSQQNYLLFKQVADIIFRGIGSNMIVMMRKLTDCHSDNFVKVQRLLISLMSEGFSFMFMKQIPEISFSVMEEIALKITLLSENELFPFILLGNNNFSTEISQFHLSICKDIEKGLKQRQGIVPSSIIISFDYFSILEKDLKSLKLLASRYRRIGKFHQNLIDEMTQIIERNKKADSTPNNAFSLSDKPMPVYHPPQQVDDILSKQIEQALNYVDDVSFLSDNSFGDWDDFFK